MRKLCVLGLVAASSLATCSASTLSCVNPPMQPNISLVGYQFEVSFPAPSGGGSGAGKATKSLVVQFPLTSSFFSLYELTEGGEYSPSCVLIESADGVAAAVTTLKTVVFTDLKLQEGNYYTNNTPGPVVQLTLSFTDITISPQASK